jgi:hypothetical protein
MNLTEITKVAKFQQKRRRGDLTKLATESGYSVSHVSNVMNGRRFNSSITSAAYRMANRRLTNAQLVSRLKTEVAVLSA